jgi:hypothetical protein
MSNLPWPFPRPEKAAFFLFAIMMTLIVAHLIAMQIVFNEALEMQEKFSIEYWHFSVFDLDEEESFGTWFSAVILLVASTILIYQARVLRAREDAWYRWWMILGWAFCLLSIDEVVGLHELLNTVFEKNSWTIAGFGVLAFIGLAYLPFLWHYRGRTATLFVIAGVLYGGGAVGIEHFSGTDLNSLRYNMLTGLEEGMEMLGIIILIYAALDFIRSDSAVEPGKGDGGIKQ